MSPKFLAALASIVLGIQMLALTTSLAPGDVDRAEAAGAEQVGGIYNSASDVFFETRYYVDSIEVCDMNGDHSNDILVGGWNSLGGGIELHLQTPPGDYSAVPDVQINMVPWNPNVVPSTYVSAVDANGDGSNDFAVVGWWNTIRGAIYNQTTTSTFEFSSYLAPDNPRQIETGDMNGDGLKDIVVDNSDSIVIFLRNQSTGFSLYPDEIICPYDAWPGYLIDEFTIADLNKDNRLDVLVSYQMRVADPPNGARITGFRVAVFYQPLGGWPGFVWENRPLTSPDAVLVDLPADSDVYCAGLGVGDLNGDGCDDVATLVGNYYTDGAVNVFPFDADIQGISETSCQTFTVGPVMIGNLPHHFDDLNQDCRDDLLFGYPVSIYYQLANGTISDTPGFVTQNLSCRGLIIADMDGDGDNDIVGADAKSVNIWFDHAVPSPPPSFGWGTPRLLEFDERGSASPPQVAMDDFGNGIAVWQQNDGTRTNIWANRYAAGSGWGTAVLLEHDDSGSAFWPKISMDGSGNAFVVWAQYNGSLSFVWATRYVASVGWEPPLRLSSNPLGLAAYAAVSCDDAGNAIAVWTEWHDVLSSRYVAGIGWETPEVIGSQVGDAHEPSIGMDQKGDAVVVWFADLGAISDIWANRYVAGSGWGDELLLETNATDYAIEPRIAVDDVGNAVAVWTQLTNPAVPWSPAHVWSTRYLTGAGWDTARLLENNSTSSAQHPRLAMDGSGNAIAAWTEVVPGVSSRVWTDRYSNALGWSTAQQLGTGNETWTHSPDISMSSSGRAVLVWIGNMVWSMMCDRGTAWGIPELVTMAPASGGRIQDLNVAVNAQGNAIAGWMQLDGSLFDVYGNTYTPREEPPPPAIIASLDIEPDTLNPSRAGRYLTAYVGLPEGFDVRDIQLDSVELNGRFPATGPSEIKDFDKDKADELMVKFDCSKIFRGDQVADRETMIMAVSGQLVDGTYFEGADTVTLLPESHGDSALSISIPVVGAAGMNSLAIPAAGAVLCVVVLLRSMRSSRTGR